MSRLLQQREVQPGFNRTLRVFTLLSANETHDFGGKIILPRSALETLVHLRIQYPMLFKLANRRYPDMVTHAGVLEFTAEEGRCYLPEWMRLQLGLVDKTDVVNVTSAFLHNATFCKFQPFSDDFLQVPDPRVILEKALRNFSTLTIGDQIPIKFNNKTYLLCVRELKPSSAVSVVETDVSIEFDPPLSRSTMSNTTTVSSAAQPNSPPTKVPTNALSSPQNEDTTVTTNTTTAAKFVPFSGSAERLDGKAVSPTEILSSPAPVTGSQQSARNALLRDSTETRKPLVPFTGTARKLTGDSYIAPIPDPRNGQSPETNEQEPEEYKPFTPFSGTAHKLSNEP
ncbi:ubiquitin recognition factor in ER-associated degradation protein 1 [Pelomyxa schiedti]|nr:ubiquitin recognition factor in ER-associated degradation protein 1 [Pelomyxa schiedti]